MRPFSSSDPFNLFDYHKLIEKVELEMSLLNNVKQKKQKKINFETIGRSVAKERVNRLYKKYINPTSIIPEFHSQIEIRKNKLTNEDIWDTVKSANLKSRIRGKIKRLNILQFIPRNEYIDKTKLINDFHFSNRNKLERYHQYIKTKNNYKKLFERNINHLQKSKDFIENKYTKEFKEYIDFLREKLETEHAINLQLLNEENKKLFEINKDT